MPFLKNKSDRVRIAAIICLRRVGIPQDKEIALQIAEQFSKDVAIEAAKTALTLTPGDISSASRLLKSRKPELVRLAIGSLLSSKAKNVWPQIESRLYDEDEEIRKLICVYAIKTFSTYRLARIVRLLFGKGAIFLQRCFSFLIKLSTQIAHCGSCFLKKSRVFSIKGSIR